MPEKRKYLRLAVKGNIALHPESDPAQTFKGELVDVGFSGLGAIFKELIETDLIVQFKCEIKIEFKTGNVKIPFSGKGIIVNVRDMIKNNIRSYRCGLKFIDMEKEIITRLLNSIQSEMNRQKRQMQKKKYL